jgi:hypothetical protein
MASSIPPATPGRIFISYRREETAYAAGWLYDRLAGHFGGGQVFKDVDSIQLGDDFVEVITRAVGSCDVLLALIGDEWLTIADAHGRRRLVNPDDFVRLEIEAALLRSVRVIPVLVDGARMPRADELPDSLAALVRRQALELSPARFDFDTSRLLKVLDRTLAEVRATQPHPTPMPAPGAAPDLSPPAPPETPDQRQQAEESPASGIPSTAPATRAGRSPSESGKPPLKRRRRLSVRARVLAGVGVGVALILVIAGIVANQRTPPPRANGVIFQDDFSSQTFGWKPYGEPGTGRYANGAYIISAPPSPGGGGGEGASPRNASGVYPSAPSDIRIVVEGWRLPASDPHMEYGISCRVHGDGNYAYVFVISDGYAAIEKYAAKYKKLKEAQFPVNATSANRLQAMCTNVGGKQAVNLQLWVNGREAAETTDVDNPHLTGTVGLVVGTDRTTRVSIAEFDNFAVSRA